MARSEPLDSTVAGSPKRTSWMGKEQIPSEKGGAVKPQEGGKIKKKYEWLLGQASWDFKIRRRGSNHILNGMKARSCCLTHRPTDSPAGTGTYLLDSSVPIFWLLSSLWCSQQGMRFNHALSSVFSCMSTFLFFPVLCTMTALVLDDCLPWICQSKLIFLEFLACRMSSCLLSGGKKLVLTGF